MKAGIDINSCALGCAGRVACSIQVKRMDAVSLFSHESGVCRMHTENVWCRPRKPSERLCTHARACVRASRAIRFKAHRCPGPGCEPGRNRWLRSRTYARLIPAARVEPLIWDHPSSSAQPHLHPIPPRPQPPGVPSLLCVSDVAAPARRFVPPSCAARATAPGVALWRSPGQVSAVLPAAVRDLPAFP